MVADIGCNLAGGLCRGNMVDMEFHLKDGFEPQDRPVVAQIDWQAFRQKLGLILSPDTSALALYERRGFLAKETETQGPLRNLFRFDAATRMFMQVD